MVFFDRFIIGARLAVETVDLAHRIELYDIFVADFVFGKQHDMFGFRAVAVIVHIVRHVQFATDDILETAFFALFGEI